MAALVDFDANINSGNVTHQLGVGREPLPRTSPGSPPVGNVLPPDDPGGQALSQSAPRAAPLLHSTSDLPLVLGFPRL